MMKVLVRAKSESVVIGGEIIVTVLDVNDEDVVLGIDAPEWVEVCEEETFERSEPNGTVECNLLAFKGQGHLGCGDGLKRV
jgi:carbon storage regulator CsrA